MEELDGILSWFLNETNGKAHKEIIATKVECKNKIIAFFQPEIKPTNEHRIPIDNYLFEWSKLVGIEYRTLFGDSRKRDVIKYRQMIQAFLWDECLFSCSYIGLSTNRDHATVIHTRKQVMDWIETDKVYANEYYHYIYKLKEAMNILTDNDKPIDLMIKPIFVGKYNKLRKAETIADKSAIKKYHFVNNRDFNHSHNRTTHEEQKFN